MMGRELLLLATILSGFAALCGAVVRLEHESTAYIPWKYDGLPLYEYNKDAAIKSAYDGSGMVYTVGSNLLHVVSIVDVLAPSVVYSQTYIKGSATDVTLCGNRYAAVSFHNEEWPLDGKIFLYESLNVPGIGFSLSKIHEIAVGARPNTIKFVNSCRRLVVTIGGEPVVHAGELSNPEGAIVFVEWADDDLSKPYTLKNALFTKFNARADEYTAKGVRWVFRGGVDGHLPTTFSQDMEPRGIVFNRDESIGYVMLQENNAIAKVNITGADVMELYAIGTKTWNLTGYDTSDRDGGVHIEPYATRGMYQPSAGVSLIVSGTEHIMLVNQGAWKTYTTPTFPYNWTEIKRGTEFVSDDLLDASVSADLKAQLLDDRFLGRHYFSTVDGKTPSGKYSTFYSYGGRDLAFWRAEDSTVMYDTGKTIEQAIADNYETVFNSDPELSSLSPTDAKDASSPLKGPEPNSIEGAQIDDKIVFFVANARPGVVSIHSLPLSGSGMPTLESVSYHGGVSGRTWEQFYNDGESWDVGASDVDFIHGVDHPEGADLLIVTGRITGSLAFYRVTDGEKAPPKQTKKKAIRIFDPRLCPVQFKYFQEDMGMVVTSNPAFIALVVVAVLFTSFALIAFMLKYFHQRKMRRLAEKHRNDQTIVDVKPDVSIIQP